DSPRIRVARQKRPHGGFRTSMSPLLKDFLYHTKAGLKGLYMVLRPSSVTTWRLTNYRGTVSALRSGRLLRGRRWRQRVISRLSRHNKVRPVYSDIDHAEAARGRSFGVVNQSVLIVGGFGDLGVRLLDRLLVKVGGGLPAGVAGIERKDVAIPEAGQPETIQLVVDGERGRIHA